MDPEKELENKERKGNGIPAKGRGRGRGRQIYKTERRHIAHSGQSSLQSNSYEQCRDACGPSVAANSIPNHSSSDSLTELVTSQNMPELNAPLNVQPCHPVPNNLVFCSSPPDQETEAQSLDLNDVSLEIQQKMKNSSLPPRPGYGTLGKKIKLISNCFPVKFPSCEVYHYDVELIKQVGNLQSEITGTSSDKKYRCLNTKTKRRVVELLLETNENFSGMYAAFDGKKNLYTREELKFDFPLRCQVNLFDENSDDPCEHSHDVYIVEIKPVKKRNTLSCSINLNSIQALFDGKTSSVPQEAIMALETILRHSACLRFTPIGRSFFSPSEIGQLNPIGGGLEIWFGYHQSVRLGQWKPTVTLDISAATFLQPGPVLDYIAELMDISVEGLRRIPFLNEEQMRKLNKKLNRKLIRTTHLKYRAKHRILRLIRENANEKYFDWNVNGETKNVSISQYFKENYGRVLEYPNLPCLQIAPEDKNRFLPIEVCEFTPGQHNKSKLSQAQKTEMIKFTSVPPTERFLKIDNIVKKINFNSDKCTNEFQVEVSTTPLDVDGRILDAPSILYQDARQIRPQNGSWNLLSTKFLHGAKISRSVLLNFSRVPRHILKKFGELFVDIGRKLGMEIDGPPVIQFAGMGCDKRTLLSEVKANAELVIIVIPTMAKEAQENAFYGEVKSTAETVVGLTTQCVKETTVRSVMGKRGPQIINNLCLKINVKRYGENNSLVISQIPSILRKPVIIIGADVNHPAPTENNRISLAACVGSLDSICKRCSVSIRAQVYSQHEKKSKEIICDLESMVKELLLAFYRHTRQKPEKIIFYRDGVSEGEFADVKKHEVVGIRKACKSLSSDYEPGITFIVAQKRHHVRNKPQDLRGSAIRTQNVPPGTVIDTDISHPVNFDFFLYSQQGLQGTSSPPHYTVLEDDNEFSANDLQKMTFQLCHMYARCTKSISLPAPVAYAHLAAYRARKHLEATEGGDASNSSDLDFRLVQEQIDAVKVLDDLKTSMYFV